MVLYEIYISVKDYNSNGPFVSIVKKSKILSTKLEKTKKIYVLFIPSNFLYYFKEICVESIFFIRISFIYTDYV